MSEALIYACTFDGCDYQMFDAAYGDVEEHWFLTHVAALDAARLAKALDKLGYPPVRREQSAAGPSGHFVHDNDAYAALIVREYESAHPYPDGLVR